MAVTEHGGAGSGYAAGCRCEPCTAAHRVRIRTRRDERIAQRTMVDGRPTAPLLATKHGTPTTYANWYCRCIPCTVAWSDDQRRRRTTGGAS